MNWLNMFWEAVKNWIVENNIGMYFLILLTMLITAIGVALHGRSEGE